MLSSLSSFFGSSNSASNSNLDTAASFNIDDIGYTITNLREFCQREGLKEVYVQHRKSILAACEDPETMSVYFSGGVK
jgi:hypothetical protein